MADVWRAEVNVDEVVLLMPDPTPPPAAAGDQAFAYYALVAADASRDYSIEVAASWHSYGVGPLYEYRTRVTCRIAGGAAFLQQDFSADGAGSAAFEGGGVLAIEKDLDADEVRFETPLGTVTTSLSGAGITDNLAMRPVELGIRLNREFGMAPSASTQNLVRWNHFWGSQNGVRTMGAPMSDDQPGSFTAWTEQLGAGPPNFMSDFTQEARAFLSSLFVTAGDNTLPAAEQWESTWTGGVAIPPMTLPAIELARSDEHGLIWAAYTTSAYRDRLNWRRSHDGGATWTEGVIDDTASQVVRNANLYWYGGDLVANWTDGNSISQARSRSLGEHWTLEPGVLLFASLADNPRLRVVCDRRHGVVYAFLRESVAGDLILYRSFDKGASFPDDPITVAASVDDAILDATITQDSRIHVRYRIDGDYATVTSSNWGQNWTIEDTAVGLGTNPRSCEDPRSGWTFHVNWVALNTSLLGYGDPEFGLRAANFSTPAGPGLDEQVADVEMRPDGVPLIAYWDTGEVFSTARSFDYCTSWET